MLLITGNAIQRDLNASALRAHLFHRWPGLHHRRTQTNQRVLFEYTQHQHLLYSAFSFSISYAFRMNLENNQVPHLNIAEVHWYSNLNWMWWVAVAANTACYWTSRGRICFRMGIRHTIYIMCHACIGVIFVCSLYMCFHLAVDTISIIKWTKRSRECMRVEYWMTGMHDVACINILLGIAHRDICRVLPKKRNYYENRL